MMSFPPQRRRRGQRRSDIRPSRRADFASLCRRIVHSLLNDPNSAPSGPIEQLESRILCSSTPLISEFMASNATGLTDYYGDHSDWIEISNPSAQTLNLTGYYLTDSKSDPTKWAFPSGSIPGGGYAVVFASGRNSVAPNGEIHTSFSLGSDGEYLALVAPDGQTVLSSYDPFPAQLPDISYGVLSQTQDSQIIGPAGTARWLVPTDSSLGNSWTQADFDDSSWTTGTAGIGYDLDNTPPVTPNFSVRMVDTNGGTDGSISGISDVEQILSGNYAPGTWNIAFDGSNDYPNVNFGQAGNIGGDNTLPNGYGAPGSNDSSDPHREQYVLRATANVHIPAGTYTIAVGSDDGFMLSIPGITFTNKISENFTNSPYNSASEPGYVLMYSAARGHAITMGTFTVPSGGISTSISLDYYEATVGDDVELTLAPGSQTTFAVPTFQLLQDGLLGWGVSTTSTVPPPDYNTELGQNGSTLDQMHNVNSSVYLRMPFGVGDTDQYDSLKLSVKYDDGFVAYVNGVEIARRNAPANVAWSSSATAAHNDADAIQYEDILIPLPNDLLISGQNVLAIQGLNVSASDLDFLISPTLSGVQTITSSESYFTTPTPGAPNSTAGAQRVADTKFNHDRGFYTSPFLLNIATDTPGAQIRYTLDGTAPTATSGSIFVNSTTTPIYINSTTTVRAAAFKAGMLSTNVDTETYIFLQDVLRQSPTNQPPSPSFPSSWGGNTTDYGMDIRITTPVPMSVYYNGNYYFTATDSTNGLELWKSGGTSATTVLVKSIANTTLGSSPADLVVCNGKLFFRASNGSTNGQELWVSDGTSAGTVMVADVNGGSGSSYPTSLTAVGNTLFFSAYAPGTGFQLYKSNGTAAGTVLVKQINTGGSSYATNFVAVGSTLFFTATDGSTGYELWKSDGTTAGTALVKDINLGSASSYPMALSAVGTRLYFTATDNANGYEAWVSDGTSGGTFMLKNIGPGSISSYPANFTAIGNTVFFTAGDPTASLELWQTDGTTAGTIRAADLNPGANGSDISNLTAFNGNLYFSATDGIHGHELWKYDPIAGAATMLQDIYPGPGDSAPANFTILGATLYFTATSPAGGTELWKTDGTPANTVQATDINPGAASSNPANIVAGGSTLFFSASDATGMGLWKISAGVTSLVRRLTFGTSPSVSSSDLLSLPSFELSMNPSDLWGGNGIYSNPSGSGKQWERPGSLELLNPDGTDGFQSNVGVRIRGGYSRSTSNPKHGFRFYFRSQYGNSKLNYPLFGPDGAQSFNQFDLRTSENYSWSFDPQITGSGYSNLQFVQDQVNRDLQIAMGDIGSHGNFYNLYINGMYFGVYNTDERPEADFASSYLGGSPDDYDVIKVDPQSGYNILATDGNTVAWSQLWTALTTKVFDGSDAGMANYYALQGLNPDGSPILDPKTGKPDGTKDLLDIDNLIDYMLDIFYSGNLDAPLSNFLSNSSPNNFFAYRDRTGAHGGFRFVVHDAEHTFLNVNENRTGPYPVVTSVTKSNPQWMFQLLEANPEFRLRVADKIHQFFFNNGVLTPSGVLAQYNARASQIDRAMAGESARWGDSKRSDAPLNRNFDWLNEMDYMTNDDPSTSGSTTDSYISQRTNIVFGQLQADSLYPTTKAPEFNQPGGNIQPGFNLTISNPNGTGTIYYTLDGSDPRTLNLDAAGVRSVAAVSPTALVYTGSAIPLNHTTTVNARIRSSTGVWSALSSQTFVYNMSGLSITEMMYQPPAPPAGSPYTADDFEFIELQNTGSTTLNLAGVQFTSGITFTFPSMNLSPGQRTVVVHNQAAFLSLYGNGISIAGVYTGLLSDKGEEVTLADPAGNPLVDFTYSNNWYPITAGGGYSLVTRTPGESSALMSSSDGWRPSNLSGGAPGAADPGINPGSIVVNEVLANTSLYPGDWVELKNTTNAPIDISGWFLSDSDNNLQKYQIPQGTIVPANGYYVFQRKTSFGVTGGVGVNSPFGFSSLGEVVNLSSSDGNGNLAGYRDHASFGAADPEISWGRVTKSTGGSDFVPLLYPTMGSANAGPKIGPVIINEMMYNPVAGQDEWIELKNITGQAIPLYDVANPANPWKMTDGVDFTFPAGASVPAYGYALVVPMDPALFRNKYQVPLNIPIYGPYTGALDNAGENVEISKPSIPDPIAGTFVYIPVDDVKYGNSGAWPTQANGTGSSLIRINPAAYGSDAANWTASPFGGTMGLPNGQEPPTIDLGADPAVPLGSIFSRSASFNDPNSAQTWTATVNYGDGTSGPLTLAGQNFTLNHLYNKPGTYTLSVTVNDSVGGTNTQTLNVSILPAVQSGTTGNDTFTLRLDPSGKYTQFFTTATGAALPANPDFLILTSALAQLQYTGNNGDDTLAIDMTYGNPLPTTGLTFDGGPGSDQITITGNPTATLAYQPATGGTGKLTLNLKDLNFTGIEQPISTTGFSAVTINTPAGTDDALTINSAPPGRLQLSGTGNSGAYVPLLFADSLPITVNTGSGNDSLAVNAGILSLTIPNTNLALTASNASAITFNASTTLASLTVNDNARVTLSAGIHPGLTLGSLTLAGSGTLDLVNNSLILPYTNAAPTASIQQYAQAGRDTGFGLIASDAANPNASPFSRTLAVWDNASTKFSSFDGVTLVDSNQVLVKYTYFGDANLDGQVTPTDYAIVDGNIGQNHDWGRGDLNGDGNTTPADYALIDGNIGAGNGTSGGPPLTVLAQSTSQLPLPPAQLIQVAPDQTIAPIAAPQLATPMQTTSDEQPDRSVLDITPRKVLHKQHRRHGSMKKR